MHILVIHVDGHRSVVHLRPYFQKGFAAAACPTKAKQAAEDAFLQISHRALGQQTMLVPSTKAILAVAHWHIQETRIAHLQTAPPSTLDQAPRPSTIYQAQLPSILLLGGMFARRATIVVSILSLAPSLSSPREVPQVDRTGPQTFPAKQVAPVKI